jgi:hypothetical protein
MNNIIQIKNKKKQNCCYPKIIDKYNDENRLSFNSVLSTSPSIPESLFMTDEELQLESDNLSLKLKNKINILSFNNFCKFEIK